MPYQIFKAAALHDTAQGLAGATNLFMSASKRYWVDFVCKDHAPELKSESHDHEADIYVVLEGDGVISLGGTLTDPTSPREGQHRGSGLEGAETFAIAQGDVIVIPEGVPHMVDTRTSRLVWLVVKADVSR